MRTTSGARRESARYAVRWLRGCTGSNVSSGNEATGPGIVSKASVNSNTSSAYVGRHPYHAHRNPASDLRDWTAHTEPGTLDNTAPSWIDACSW